MQSLCKACTNSNALGSLPLIYPGTESFPRSPEVVISTGLVQSIRSRFDYLIWSIDERVSVVIVMAIDQSSTANMISQYIREYVQKRHPWQETPHFSLYMVAIHLIDIYDLHIHAIRSIYDLPGQSIRQPLKSPTSLLTPKINPCISPLVHFLSLH